MSTRTSRCHPPVAIRRRRTFPDLSESHTLRIVGHGLEIRYPKKDIDPQFDLGIEDDPT